MYNAELKERFLDSYTSNRGTRKVASRILESFSTYEENCGADICTRTTEELQPFIDGAVGVRKSSQCTAINVLREYTKWCIANGVPNACDGIFHVKIVGLNQIRLKMVANPLHLQKYLDEIFDSESAETIDIVYRCHCWMAFGGIEEKDTIKIKCSDIDFNLMRINYNDTSVPIYREALPAFHKAVELNSFRYVHPNYEPTRKDRVAGDTVMRRFTPDTSVRTIRTGLTRYAVDAVKAGKTSQQLSFYHIQLSGLFYRTYEFERAGGKVGFAQFARDYVNSREFKIVGGNREVQLQYKMNHIEKNYTEDYQRWKLAFIAS